MLKRVKRVQSVVLIHYYQKLETRLSPKSNGSRYRIIAVHHREDATKKLLSAHYFVKMFFTLLRHLEHAKSLKIAPK